MSYHKFLKYIMKRNENNPDIDRNFKFNQKIKKDFGKQLSLKNDLDVERLIISEPEALEFMEKHGDKYEVFISEYNTVIAVILEDLETKSNYTIKGNKVTCEMTNIHLKALAKDLSDHRLNVSKVHPGLIYKTHYQFYLTSYKMFQMMLKKAIRKTKPEASLQITEQEAKEFGYTYTLQRTYGGIKATITNVNQDNSILFIPSMIGQFPVVAVHKLEVGSQKRNHIIM
ncbi:MAG: hypothetical protein EP317_06005 [Bacillota bacterium]|nr:MAG: hypothetical protein EP317_06005 [Bacillota bacterium]